MSDSSVPAGGTRPIRLGLGTGYDPSANCREMGRWMHDAEERGFEVGFFSETAELMRDSVTALSSFAASTTTMTLGCTQVVRLRSPLIMAQTIASLDELSGGRIMLAPGACTNTHARRNGLPEVDSVRGLVEQIEVLRLLLTGEKVTYEGETVTLTDVSLGWRPLRADVPLYVASTSRRGLQIAGSVGDGVLLNAVCSPEYTENAVKILRAASDEAGRDWSKFTVAQLINCSIEDDHQLALDRVRWEVASKLNPFQIEVIFRSKARVGEPYMHVEDIERFKQAWRDGGKEGLLRAVPDSYVEGMTAVGDIDTVAAKVQRYFDAGVDICILRPAAPHQLPDLLTTSERLKAAPAHL
jgi:5,10-methylenetetrahydromethanopterin reductase